MKRIAIFIALLCVCIRMSAAVTYSGTLPATTTHLVGSETKTFLDLTNCTTNATITEGSIGTFAMGLHYIIETLKPAWASGDYANLASASTDATGYGFLKTTTNDKYDAYSQAIGAALIQRSKTVVLYVTGITDFAVWGKDYSSTEYLQIKVAEISNDGTVGTESTTESIKSTTEHITQVSSLDGTKFYRITLTCNDLGPCHTYQVRFIPVLSEQSVAVGAKGYATYCNSSYALDFTGKSIKAFTISSTDGSTLTLTQKDKVAKGEPVLLYSETSSDSQSIPAIADNEATTDSSNKLVAGDGNTHTWVESITEHYILYSGGATPGFWQANNSRVAVGKAYLDLTGVAAGAPNHFNLEVGGNEATGISATLNNNEQIINNNVFDILGRCVAKPAKGLYIVNGKKVLKK